MRPGSAEHPDGKRRRPIATPLAVCAVVVVVCAGWWLVSGENAVPAGLPSAELTEGDHTFTKLDAVDLARTTDPRTHEPDPPQREEIAPTETDVEREPAAALVSDLLAAGIVLDERHVPIVGASIGLLQAEELERSTGIELPTAVSGPDGRFELRAPAHLHDRFALVVQSPPTVRYLGTGGARMVREAVRAGDQVKRILLVAQAEDGRHATEVTEPGGTVEFVLARRASVTGTAWVPDWMPAPALSFELLSVPRGSSAGGGRQRRPRPATASVSIESGLATFTFDDLPTERHQFAVHLRGLPEALVAIADIDVRPENPRPPRLQGLELRGTAHRYELRAVAATSGEVLTDLPSPLLVQTGEGWRAFRWRSDGTYTLFANRRELTARVVAAGYKTESVTLRAGVSDVPFQPLQPVEVVLPGLRALCDPDRKVRVSMILTSDSNLPQSIRGIDQTSGESQGYNRWHLSKSGGAWLAETDSVYVPLVHNGDYRVMVRLHQEGVSGDASIDVGVWPVVLDGAIPDRIVIPFDQDKIRAGLEQLAARAEERAQAQVEAFGFEPQSNPQQIDTSALRNMLEQQLQQETDDARRQAIVRMLEQMRSGR